MTSAHTLFYPSGTASLQLCLLHLNITYHHLWDFKLWPTTWNNQQPIKLILIQTVCCLLTTLQDYELSFFAWWFEHHYHLWQWPSSLNSPLKESPMTKNPAQQCQESQPHQYTNPTHQLHTINPPPAGQQQHHHHIAHDQGLYCPPPGFPSVKGRPDMDPWQQQRTTSHNAGNQHRTETTVSSKHTMSSLPAWPQLVIQLVLSHVCDI